MNTEGYQRSVNRSTIPGFERPVYSFAWLCEAMRDRHMIRLMDNYGSVRRGVIVGLMPESGSGKDWLVKLQGEDGNIYVKAV